MFVLGYPQKRSPSSGVLRCFNVFIFYFLSTDALMSYNLNSTVMRKVLVTLENCDYFLFYAEAFLPEWRTGFVSISTSGFGNSQVSNLQVHSITTNFLRSRWLACL